ncbi:MAG: hypothetical protein A3C84_02220 [Candidatus Ryanbacteria bacterium RIFCSPHIGHO2_02_FULL_48_12]|uniref:Aspartate--tRNA(Asp/Asn) ligase n=1 Tax=Candidatus Ryanbacteria bacterium RIFCSPHIGHO2_01_FULL_48_27 TaxID=1802115 RepID=A0A1G2G3G9_9BACT|nr:MAG: hypothetical protein A2756_04650 [Candidatus Ryanbacteria bacterium RIFCSPHIGHO2_01_FULL_48_27]OGZ49268.1 MAG: hypothetical protein A3C84_02220 [Candidatus Ryanbacteria bacterium RIFCSPHIGHO2_02_FULL_48_12]
MNRTYIKDTLGEIGKEVVLKGWVDVRRDHGKLIFIDLRDVTGVVQTVFFAGNKEVYEIANTLRPEWVVEIQGIVQERPESMRNANIPTGGIEISGTTIEVLNQSQTPPFDLGGDGREIGEEHRLTYRYLDLRRPRLKKNFVLRHKITKFIRDFLDSKGFIEVETPILTKSTPEGARDYLVPSRLQQGSFYALPQSPQQYKQLLMVAGLERYFQIARCFRDEDTRGDRQPEFTQLDLEMSFVDREEVMALNEELLVKIVQTLAPEKKIQEMPFPRITYAEAMKTYGTDRPDLRTDKDDPDLLAFCWITDFPFFETTGEGGWTFTHNPFSRPIPEHEAWLMDKSNIGEIVTTQYDVALNGFEIGGGSIRNHNPQALEKVFEIMGFTTERIRENFGHILEALGYGAPPHGGIAWGLDRLISLLTGEPNIREVIAFPKTGDGRDLMMHAPSEVDNAQLRELGIQIKKS